MRTETLITVLKDYVKVEHENARKKEAALKEIPEITKSLIATVKSLQSAKEDQKPELLSALSTSLNSLQKFLPGIATEPSPFSGYIAKTVQADGGIETPTLIAEKGYPSDQIIPFEEGEIAIEAISRSLDA